MPIVFSPKKGKVKAKKGVQFDAATLAELARDVSANEEVAEANWDLQPSYRSMNGRIVAVTLKITLTMTMPVWPAYTGRPQAEKDEWDRFYCALRHHEDGHHAIIRAEADKMLKALKAANPQNFTQVAQRETARLQKLSDKYDKDTVHGQSQDSPCGNTVIEVR